MEIWAIRKDLSTIKTFKTLKEADEFKGDYFQIIYRNHKWDPIHIYKTNIK